MDTFSFSLRNSCCLKAIFSKNLLQVTSFRGLGTVRPAGELERLAGKLGKAVLLGLFRSVKEFPGIVSAWICLGCRGSQIKIMKPGKVLDCNLDQSNVNLNESIFVSMPLLFVR